MTRQFTDTEIDKLVDWLQGDEKAVTQQWISDLYKEVIPDDDRDEYDRPIPVWRAEKYDKKD